MQKVQTELVSDLSGAPADETVRFALDGAEYEIDLSAEEAGQMRDGLAPFTGHARRNIRRRAPARSRRPSRNDLPEIREYAKARGHEINDRGRVPLRIIEEYDLLKGYSGSS